MMAVMYWDRFGRWMSRDVSMYVWVSVQSFCVAQAGNSFPVMLCFFAWTRGML